MVHTALDYSTKYKLATIFGQIDTGELAARLGSPVVYDRRGNLMWMDDFEDGINKWAPETNGLGGAVESSIETAFFGAKSCKLTAGSTLGRYAQIRRSFQLPILGGVGVEYTHNVFVTGDYLRLTVQFLYGGTVYVASVQYDGSDDKLYYLNDANVYVESGIELDLVLSVDNFYTLKLVADFRNNKYMRLMFANKFADLSAHNLYTTPAAGPDFMSVAIHLKGDAASNRFCYIDNVILTQNEP